MTSHDWPIQAEVFAKLPEAVGNITFTPDSDVIFSQHPFFAPSIRVAKLNEDRTGSTPWPNLDWNTPKADSDHYFDSVLGLRGDGNGVVWMLDMGTRTGVTPKLVGWNSNTDQLERIYYIPAPSTLPESQHNDFTIDEKRGMAIIADEGIGPGGDGTKAALVTIDMKTGKTRRLLQGHESCLPEDVPIKLGDRILTVIYRVRLDDIANETLSAEELGNRVYRYAGKPNNGGLGIDRAGNLYLTAVETTAVGIIPADTGRYAKYASHPDLIWPDGVSYAPDGFMYVSAAQVSEAAGFNSGTERNAAPYFIFRFPPLAPGRLGH